MKRPGSQAAVVLASFLLLSPLGSIGVAGINHWTTGAMNFPDGDYNGTVLQDGAVVLDQRALSSGNWSKVLDWISPPPRRGAAMCYNSVIGAVILYGGYLSYSNVLSYSNDTWVYSSRENCWKEMRPGQAPPSRAYTSMAFDEKNGVAVVYGGFGASTLNDTWTYDLSSNKWSRVATAQDPGPRTYHKMVYDSRAGGMILFSGRGNASYNNDTWYFDTATGIWTNLTTTESPPGRSYFGMAYDRITGESIIYGGINGSASFNDTWAFNCSSKSWRRLAVPTPPPARYGHEMVYDQDADAVILYGGWINDTYDDTWSFDMASCSWTRKAPGASPPGGAEFELTYDSGIERTIFFGGNRTLRDTWTYDAANDTWMDMNITGPSPGWEFGMVYDERHNVSLVFGPGTGNDTWTYDSRANAWTERKPERAPDVRWAEAMSYDTGTGLAILFGGELSSAPIHVYTNDTWTYDYDNDSWEPKAHAGLPAPPPMKGAAMAYDSKNRVNVLFGGYIDYGYGISNETWLYYSANDTWVNANPQGPVPSPRGYMSMAYDSRNGVVVLFGGTGDTGTYYDTWTYDAALNIWEKKETPENPPARFHHRMVYVPEIESVVMFGGAVGAEDYLRDIWLFNLETNKWVQKRPDTWPPARWAQGMCYDRANGAVVLFSGETWGSRPSPDVWLYQINGTAILSGTYTSYSFGTRRSAYFGSLVWDADVPVGTSLSFQLRAANNSDNLSAMPFVGPDGTERTCYRISGQAIPPIINGSQWIQYRACMLSMFEDKSPTLRSVNITYNLVHQLTLLSPVGGENWTGIHQLKWTASDKDNDPLLFDVHLEYGNSSVLLYGSLPNGTTERYWDTDTLPNGTYRIRVTARDDNPYLPLTVAATSGNFTIFHAPPNEPPHVELLSPPDLSIIDTASARLEWCGTDPDGDHLEYRVRHSDGPLGQSPETVSLTNESFFDLSGLKNGTTYYWTVDASDGANWTTHVHADVWRFTVRLPVTPPPNRPPKIWSAPPTFAYINMSWSYDVMASDEDGDAVSFILIEAPEGMVIDQIFGVLSWAPRADQKGLHKVALCVLDGKGGFEEQRFELEAKEAPALPRMPPSCLILLPQNGTVVSGKIKVEGITSNGTSQVALVEVRVDDGGWEPALGSDSWRLLIDTRTLLNGPHTITVRAFDGTLYSNETAVSVTVNNQRVVEPSSSRSPWAPLAIVAGLLVLALYFMFRADKKR